MGGPGDTYIASNVCMYLLEQIYSDFLPYLTVHDMIALTIVYGKRKPSHPILCRNIRDRINAFPASVSIADHISPVKYVTGETSGDTRTERWTFASPIHSQSLPVDTFSTILSTPWKQITITCPLVQYTHHLVPPEKLQDGTAMWCLRQTRDVSVWVYYSYDDHEMLSNGTYYDFLNQSYEHLVISGIRITYNTVAMNDRMMMSGIVSFLSALAIADTTSPILFSGIWAILWAILRVIHYMNDVIQITAQPTIF